MKTYSLGAPEYVIRVKQVSMHFCHYWLDKMLVVWGKSPAFPSRDLLAYHMLYVPGAHEELRRT